MLLKVGIKIAKCCRKYGIQSMDVTGSYICCDDGWQGNVICCDDADHCGNFRTWNFLPVCCKCSPKSKWHHMQVHKIIF